MSTRGARTVEHDDADLCKACIMRDYEYFDEGKLLHASRVNKDRTSLGKKILTRGAIMFGLIALVFGIGLLASHCRMLAMVPLPYLANGDNSDGASPPEAELIHAEQMVSEAAHELARRGECGEDGIPYNLAGNVVMAQIAGSSGLGTGTGTGTGTGIPFRINGTVGAVGTTGYTLTAKRGTGRSTETGSVEASVMETSQTASELETIPFGVSIPISTQTAVSTIYSIRTTDEFTTRATQTTAITYVPPESEEDGCTADPTTKTLSVYVTVSPVPIVTITAGRLTATQYDTDVSFTDGLPDVTLSELPSTRTAVLTHVSFTNGPPDVTISALPDTQTDVLTDVSFTAGPPDATVSGKPSTVTHIEASISPSQFTTITITNLWGTFSPQPLTTVTETDTTQRTVTEYKSVTVTAEQSTGEITITITDPFNLPASSTSTSTSANAYSSALGEALTPMPSEPDVVVTQTFTTTVKGGPPAVSFTTVRVPARGTNGTVDATPSAVVVSDGGKRTAPRGWGSSNGSGSLGCLIMLGALIVLAL
ncbi:hypothetical protein DCS_04835 [Drechmeria coniospora]|uniref:Uncharacterized protein n=1 Tax=Drechmeria coniospora TaxID=98403 RepID=A0A151GLE1_DRECN|nr:hypothetical protein DCS_04835 [Drechmeria coniospora]KYK57822.1 hypothetical protein DCS_04835 [Drechmeria coniospora]